MLAWVLSELLATLKEIATNTNAIPKAIFDNKPQTEI